MHPDRCQTVGVRSNAYGTGRLGERGSGARAAPRGGGAHPAARGRREAEEARPRRHAAVRARPSRPAPSAALGGRSGRQYRRALPALMALRAPRNAEGPDRPTCGESRRGGCRRRPRVTPRAPLLVCRVRCKGPTKAKSMAQARSPLSRSGEGSGAQRAGESGPFALAHLGQWGPGRPACTVGSRCLSNRRNDAPHEESDGRAGGDLLARAGWVRQRGPLGRLSRRSESACSAWRWPSGSPS